MNSDDIILIDNVTKSFGDKTILNGVTINIRRGETMVIVGQSGTGKSVTLKHIMGLLTPDSGAVYIDGERMDTAGDKKKADLRSRMGVLFQSGALINWLTVFDNVALPLREHRIMPEKEIQQVVSEKLEWLGLTKAKDLLPGSISGGMKKRVGLARAITTQPELLMYDEPTSGLDPVMSQVINELVVKMQKELQVTQLVVTHDMSSAYYIADRITFLYQGKVEFVGSPNDVKTTKNQIVRQFVEGKTSGPMIVDAGDPTARRRNGPDA